jgi:hypothetical protein
MGKSLQFRGRLGKTPANEETAPGSNADRT